MNWSSRPFVRILLFLISGILLAYWLPAIAHINLFFLTILLGIVTATAFIIYKLSSSWKYQWLLGALLGFAIFLTGILLVNIKQSNISDMPIVAGDTFIGRIVEEPVKTKNSIRTVISIYQIKDNDSVSFNRVNVLAYFAKSELSENLTYGDIVIFNGSLTNPEGPKNPGEFNYADFLLLNNVGYQVYIPDDSWNLLGVSSKSLITLAIDVRNYLLNVLKENGIKGDDFAVAAAILLGYDQLLESELEQNYVTAGAMHILCVSGLHVGIIYLVLNFLLGFLRRNKFQRSLKVVLLLGIIWFYALITGFSPSVQRASVMISLFIIANMSSKQKDVYNTLAASAVILLFTNPFLIFNVGFQLSYTAVLGILLFYKPIAGIFYIKNPLLRKVWEVVAVSAAAQLGTFPLAAHYFHFFPTYFWLTNIFIFPLSFAIVGTGILLMAISWIPVISNVVGIILSGFVFLLNFIISAVKQLPYNGIHDLHFPWFKVTLVYILILILVPLLLKGRIKLLLPCLLTLLLILLFNTNHRFQVLQQNRLVVYCIKKSTAIDFIKADKHVLLVDSILMEDDKKLDYQLSNCRISWGLEDHNQAVNGSFSNENLNLYYDGQFGSFGHITFMRISDKEPFQIQHPPKLDFIVISGKKRLNVEKLLKAVTCNYLIIDSSVPYWKQKKIEEQAKSLQLMYFNVNEQGACIVNL